MQTTLVNLDITFVNRVQYGFPPPLSNDHLVRFNEEKKGDVILINDPTKKSYSSWIKRVVATSGESVAIKIKYYLLMVRKLIVKIRDYLMTPVLYVKKSLMAFHIPLKKALA
jgi:signal peptidase I